MKKAIKVLIIIHMGLFFFLFYPFFYGFKALEKLDKATSKQELVATGIFSILPSKFQQLTLFNPALYAHSAYTTSPL